MTSRRENVKTSVKKRAFCGWRILTLDKEDADGALRRGECVTLRERQGIPDILAYLNLPVSLPSSPFGLEGFKPSLSGLEGV